MIAILRGARLPPDVLSRLFIRFGCLQAVASARLILKDRGRNGWGDAHWSRRYDRIGTVPALLAHCLLCARDLSALDRLIAPLTPWLERLVQEARDGAL